MNRSEEENYRKQVQWKTEALQECDKLEAELAAAKNERDSLSEECKTLGLKLAACGIAAMQNTTNSMQERLRRDSPYYSASYSDVCRAVDREVSLREQLAAAKESLTDVHELLKRAQLRLMPFRVDLKEGWE